MVNNYNKPNTLRQFNELKVKYQNALLLFRVGSSYETYREDARIVSQKLGLRLFVKGGQAMTTFPHYEIDKYLPILVRAGHRIGLCEQLESPKENKPRQLMLPFEA